MASWEWHEDTAWFEILPLDDQLFTSLLKKYDTVMVGVFLRAFQSISGKTGHWNFLTSVFTLLDFSFSTVFMTSKDFFVCCVYLSDLFQNNLKISYQISIKFSGNVDNLPRINWLNLGDVMDSRGTLTFELPMFKSRGFYNKATDYVTICNHVLLLSTENTTLMVLVNLYSCFYVQ